MKNMIDFCKTVETGVDPSLCRSQVHFYIFSILLTRLLNLEMPPFLAQS